MSPPGFEVHISPCMHRRRGPSCLQANVGHGRPGLGRRGACTTSWMPCAEAELSEGFEVHASPRGLRFTLHLLQGLKPLTSPCTAVVGLAVCLQANMYCIQGEGQGQGIGEAFSYQAEACSQVRGFFLPSDSDRRKPDADRHAETTAMNRPSLPPAPAHTLSSSSSFSSSVVSSASSLATSSCPC